MVAFTRENGSFVGARWRGRPSNRERTLFWPVLAQEDASGNVQWFLADHEGSVRDAVNSSGTVRRTSSTTASGTS